MCFFFNKAKPLSNLSVNLLFFSSFVFLISCGDDRWDPEVLNKTAPMNPARMQKIDLNGSVEMEMIWAAGGSFIMGSPDSEVGRQDGRENQHEVVFSEGFFLGKYEVTQLQYRAVMGGAKSKYNADPSHFKGPDRPVEKVSWIDAQVFMDRLNKYASKTQMLPFGWRFASPLSRNGSTPAGQEHSQLIHGEIRFGKQIPMEHRPMGPNKPARSVLTIPTPGDFMTCMGMCANG